MTVTTIDILLHLGYLVTSETSFERKTVLIQVLTLCTLYLTFFVLALEERKMPLSYKQPKETANQVLKLNNKNTRLYINFVKTQAPQPPLNTVEHLAYKNNDFVAVVGIQEHVTHSNYHSNNQLQSSFQFNTSTLQSMALVLSGNEAIQIFFGQPHKTKSM